MKSLYQLHSSVLLDVGHFCSVDTAMDLKTIHRRWEDEGDSFLTITLPLLAKALEQGLEEGKWPAHVVSGKFQHYGGLPAILRGFLSRVFQKDGLLLQNPDVQSIWAVRQFCYLTQKVEMPCSPERERAAFDQFVRTDIELRGLMDRIDPRRLETFVQTAERLFGRVFQECDRKIASWELVPKHGPGAVAERSSQLDRRQYQYWHERLEDVFPYWRYTANSVYQSSPRDVPHPEEQPVRVVSVPKTQATPRIIAIEPSVMQYAQQGLKRELYELIGKGPLSRILGFQDQSRNQSMAQSGSLDSSNATLDLSEASDRVHVNLVLAMFRRFPHLRDFVDATRSSSADVPFNGVLPLEKYASMGSALTFPLEAIVFTTLAICGYEEQTGRRFQAPQLGGLVSVYGDDIIIPVEATDHVVDWLEHFGAKVNRRKSFWNGKFRESCGAEFYAGHDVSVVRARAELPSSRDDAAAIAALVDLRNRAYGAGLWGFVKDLDESISTFIELPPASVSSKSEPGYIHARTFLPTSRSGSRWNSSLHRDERKVPVLVPRSREYVIEGEAGLLEWFHDALRRGDLVDRFTSQERPTSFSIKRRWVRVDFTSADWE